VVLGHVAFVDLQHVVIDVKDGERHRDPIDPERLELHGAHGAGGVLDEDLVDVYDKIGARIERAGPAVLGEEDAREVLGHPPLLSLPPLGLPILGLARIAASRWEQR
jgi:hypothetical protein